MLSISGGLHCFGCRQLSSKMETLGRNFTTTLTTCGSPRRHQAAGYRRRVRMLPVAEPLFPDGGGGYPSHVLSYVLKIREQKVKVLTPREAGYAIQLSNKTLLDVRPSTEHEKVCVLLNWLRARCYLPLPPY
ncbi:hypothetical protein GW17_00007996 [Ensete ventricosum]|nr:hypothetical protein GW17_00007996 [Ensete ventricosum]RZR98625.1 hypothetical protein BHM03_00028007 [Ensete ventricosum]